MLMNDVAKCFTAARPVVSVYLDTPSDDPQAAAAVTLRWKNQRRALEREGVDPATLAAMDGAVGVDTEVVQGGIAPAEDNVFRSDDLDAAADHADGDALAVIAAGGEVLLRRFLTRSDQAGSWRVGPLPWITPLLRANQASVPHLVVLIDRQGADIWGTVHGPDGEADVVVDVQGDDHQITLVNQGGLSHRRIHERAVNRWKANSQEVAAEVTELVRTHRPSVVAVGGDIAAVGFFEEALPGDVRPLLRRLEAGARGPESGPDGVAEEVLRMVRTVEAEETAALLEDFRAQHAQQGRAAAGRSAVIRALQMAGVDTLLVPEQTEEEVSAWFGPEPTHVALEEGDLAVMGVEHPERAELCDVAVRAALATGANVRIVPRNALPDGIGAILRFA